MTERQWKNIDSNISRAVDRKYNILMDGVMSRISRSSKAPSNDYMKQANDRAQVLAVHSVLRDYSKKYGWNYTRKRTS